MSDADFYAPRDHCACRESSALPLPHGGLLPGRTRRKTGRGEKKKTENSSPRNSRKTTRFVGKNRSFCRIERKRHVICANNAAAMTRGSPSGFRCRRAPWGEGGGNGGAGDRLVRSRHARGSPPLITARGISPKPVTSAEPAPAGRIPSVGPRPAGIDFSRRFSNCRRTSSVGNFFCFFFFSRFRSENTARKS